MNEQRGNREKYPGKAFEKNVYQLSSFNIKDGKLFQLIENEKTENYELFVTEIQ